MSNDLLAKRCAEERERFFRRQPTDNRFCFELFRRAILYRNEHAWQILYEQYSSLVSGWIRQSSGFQAGQSDLEELVNLTFTKFWQSVPASKFRSFVSLEAVLQYLRLCAGSVVMDMARRRKHESRLMPYETIMGGMADHRNVEQDVLDDLTRQRFWQEIQTLLANETEMKVIFCYFILGMKPRQIQAAYPDTFPSVELVYQIKRNVLNRLRRSKSLERWLKE
ncbi:MAG: sigma-70 family RNA polymerase sigma factor [Ardenticatenia bacterium]|nr:sigma-70 family RNA polymerase sigma factor [Ardenticatenia bacterium]